MINKPHAVYTQVCREVHDRDEGLSVKVKSSKVVHLYTEGPVNKAMFGDLDITLNYKFARAIGEALIAAADDIERSGHE
jgi:hypothetical protein